MCEKKGVPSSMGTLVAKMLGGQQACYLGRGIVEEDMGCVRLQRGTACSPCSFV